MKIMKKLCMLIIFLVAAITVIASAQYLGSWNIDDYLVIPATTHQFSTGAAYDASSITYRIYEDDTATEIITDTAMTKFDSETGFYLDKIQLTAANGFEAGKNYIVLKKATVDSVSGISVDTFQILAKTNAMLVNGVTPPTVTTITEDVWGDPNATGLISKNNSIYNIVKAGGTGDLNDIWTDVQAIATVTNALQMDSDNFIKASVYGVGESVTSGDMVDSNDWTAESEWVVSGGVATYTQDVNDSNNTLRQTISTIVAGHSYLLTYTISGRTVSENDSNLYCKAHLGGGDYTTPRYADGTYTEIVVAGADPANQRLIFYGGGGAQGDTFNLDNVSLTPAFSTDTDSGLTLQQVRDAMKLAPSAGDSAEGSIDYLLTKPSFGR